MDAAWRTVLTDPGHLTADWLGGVLARRGLLGGAAVSAVRERDRHRSLFSLGVRYEVSYSPRAAPAARPPARLFLKLSLPESAPSRELVAAEVRFYASYGEDPALPLVRCFDTAHSAETGASHVLLEDMSETHATPLLPLPPSRAQAEAMVDALAAFHARWWEHPALGVEVGERWDEQSIVKSLAWLETSYAALRDLAGDRVSAERYAVHERVLRRWPRLARRLVGIARLTLIHGDAHAGNCLLPRDPARHPAYLIDLSTCRIRPGANDLGYMMALTWFPDVRGRWEAPLLHRYHEALVAKGVAGYSWDDLMWDYRFAVIVHLFTPVHQAAGSAVPATTWWYNLERIHAAFRDLGCAELLGA